MSKYKIYAGLGGGFGGADYQETMDFDNEEEAMEMAEDIAREEYYNTAGLHGILGYDTIKEENPDWSDKEIEDEMEEDCASWLAYRVEKVE